MNKEWTTRVAHYVDDVANVAESMNLILDETRVGINLDEEQTARCTARLQEQLETLESLVANREELLRAHDAPQEGLTLSQKLLHSRHIDNARLAKRCEEVSAAIEATHERAMALFVCQFHLADLTNDLVRTMMGFQNTETYERDGSDLNRKPESHGGGLFDEAA